MPRLLIIPSIVMPTNPARRAPEAAISRVIQELRHRELKLQAELISLRPLVKYVYLLLGTSCQLM